MIWSVFICLERLRLRSQGVQATGRATAWGTQVWTEHLFLDLTERGLARCLVQLLTITRSLLSLSGDIYEKQHYISKKNTVPSLPSKPIFTDNMANSGRGTLMIQALLRFMDNKMRLVASTLSAGDASDSLSRCECRKHKNIIRNARSSIS